MARRWHRSHLVLLAGAAYLVFISFKFHHFLDLAADITGSDPSFSSPSSSDHLTTSPHHGEGAQKEPPLDAALTPVKPFWHRYERVSMPDIIAGARNRSALDRMADEAWALGLTAWEEAESFAGDISQLASAERKSSEACPSAVAMPAESSRGRRIRDKVLFLPCGLAAGSSITLVATPREAHKEYVPQLARMRQGDGTVLVSQFMVELQGLRAVDGEDPPKILHLNPRLRGDWSQRPIIEHNTCYRMQWGAAQRCDGSPPEDNEDTGVIIHACNAISLGHLIYPWNVICHVKMLSLGEFGFLKPAMLEDG